jgi:transcriptional regulator GlxA family with amidase domain
MRSNSSRKFKKSLNNRKLVVASGDAPIDLPMAVKHDGINRTLLFATRNMDRQVKFSHLLQKSGMSRRGFFKAFSKHAGIKPGQMLRRFRIERAKRMLVEKDMGLTEIAKQCGYRSANTLWVAFRNATGLAPKKFQRQAWLGTFLSKSR